MNWQSSLLLFIVLVLAVIALRHYIKKNRNTGGCCGCRNMDCALRNAKQISTCDKKESIR